MNRPASAEEEAVEAKLLAPETEKPHDPYISLRLPALRYYLLGWFLLVIGGQMTSLAIGVKIYNLTNSKTALGVSGLMAALPVILFSLPAGAVADRRDRRKIVIVANAFTLLGILVLAYLSHIHAHVHALYAALFAIATTQAVGYPARSAILPTLVPRHIFANAMTWNTTIFSSASILGPVLAGFILDHYDPTIVFLAHAVLIAVFILVVWKLEANFTPTTDASPNPAAPKQSRLRDLTEGIHFIYGTKIIFATILLDLLAVILGGVVYVLPVFSKDILHVSETHLGFLRSGEAIGSVLMSVVIAHLPPFKKAGNSMLYAVACFGVAVIVFGLSKNFYLSFAALIIAGAFDNISVVVRHTLVNVLAPDSMRGRINAVNTVFISSSNELGGYRAGVMADALGSPVRSVVFGGLGTLASVAFIALNFKQIRGLGSLQELKELKK